MRRFTPPISQPSVVWSVIWLPTSAWLTASMMSISPLSGQLFASESQSAGHVPHPCGVCRMSNMKSPDSYCALDSNRTEKRPVDAFGSDSGPTLVSTFNTALSAVEYVRF